MALNNPAFPIFVSNKHANITSRELRTLSHHQMSILVQLMSLSEQK